MWTMFSHNICSSREVSVHDARKPDDVETRMLMAAWPAKDIESCATSSVTARMSTRVVVLLSIAFLLRYFLLSSRLTALTAPVIMNV